MTDEEVEEMAERLYQTWRRNERTRQFPPVIMRREEISQEEAFRRFGNNSPPMNAQEPYERRLQQLLGNTNPPSMFVKMPLVISDNLLMDKVLAHELRVGDNARYRIDNSSFGKVTQVNLEDRHAEMDGHFNLIIDENGFWGADGDLGFLLKEFTTDLPDFGLIKGLKRGSTKQTSRMVSIWSKGNSTVDRVLTRDCGLVIEADGFSDEEYSFVEIDSGVFILERPSGETVGMAPCKVRVFETKDQAKAFLKFRAAPAEVPRAFKVGDLVKLHKETIDALSPSYGYSEREVFDSLALGLLNYEIYEVKSGAGVSREGGVFNWVRIINPEKTNAWHIPEDFLQKISKEEYQELQKVRTDEKIKKIIFKKMEELRAEKARKVEAVFAELARSIRSEKEVAEQLKDVKGLTEKYFETIRAELERVKKNKRVSKVEFLEEDLVIKITLSNIYLKSIEYEEKDITNLYIDEPLLLGDYELALSLLDSRTHAKRLSDFPYLRGTHPHVSGAVCWGNVKAEVAQMIADFNFDLLTETFLHILENANRASVLQDINTFLQLQHHPDYKDGLSKGQIAVQERRVLEGNYTGFVTR